MAGKADDPAHRAQAFAHVAERHGRLDHLVNNAGINPAWGPVLQIDPAVAHKILAVNVVATLEWTRDAVAAGLTRSVVNLSSVSGLERESEHLVLRGVEGGDHQPHDAARRGAGVRRFASTRSHPR